MKEKETVCLLVQNELMDWFVIRHTSLLHVTITFLFSTVKTEKICWVLEVSFTLTPIQIWSQLLEKTKTLLARAVQNRLLYFSAISAIFSSWTMAGAGG
jgi:uncharacterized membrane protein